MGNSDFYSACAQVLPVLFLAAAVEFGLLVDREEDLKRWVDEGYSLRFHLVGNVVIVVGFVLTVAIGEYAALRALANQRESTETTVLVIGALCACGITLICAPVLRMVNTADAVTGGSGHQSGFAQVVAAFALLSV